MTLSSLLCLKYFFTGPIAVDYHVGHGGQEGKPVQRIGGGGENIELRQVGHV